MEKPDIDEPLQMVRHRRLGQRQRLVQLARTHRLTVSRKQIYDLHPSGIAQRLEELGRCRCCVI
jgi:hypothetical protein